MTALFSGIPARVTGRMNNDSTGVEVLLVADSIQIIAELTLPAAKAAARTIQKAVNEVEHGEKWRGKD